MSVLRLKLSIYKVLPFLQMFVANVLVNFVKHNVHGYVQTVAVSGITVIVLLHMEGAHGPKNQMQTSVIADIGDGSETSPGN